MQWALAHAWAVRGVLPPSWAESQLVSGPALILSATHMPCAGAQVVAVTDFIRNPAVFQCDLGELPAIRQLERDAQHAPVYGLLRAILGGDREGG